MFSYGLLHGVSASAILASLDGGITPPVGSWTPRPYDEVVSAAPVGAWGLRRLVTGYAGPAVRVRDTNDNSEQDVGFDSEGLLATFTTVGDAAVVRLYDQSGNGEDLVQATATRQPILIPDATPASRPAIKFDGVDDHLMGETAGTALPYMVSNPAIFIGMGGGTTTEAYAAIAQIPHADGVNNAPYYRWVLARSSSQNVMRWGQHGGEWDTFDFFSYGDIQSGWMTLGASSVIATSVVGTVRGRYGPFAGGYTYPNATRLYVGSNGAGDENFGGYITEIAIFDNIADTMEDIQAALDEIRVRTMVPQIDDIEWRIDFDDNFALGGDDSISFSELEFLVGGTDQLPTSGTKWSPTGEFNSSEAATMLADDNLSTVWSSRDHNLIPVGVTFQLPSAITPQQIRMTARGDAVYYELMPKVGTVYALRAGSWEEVTTFDFTAEGISNGQTYTFSL